MWKARRGPEKRMSDEVVDGFEGKEAVIRTPRMCSVESSPLGRTFFAYF